MGGWWGEGRSGGDALRGVRWLRKVRCRMRGTFDEDSAIEEAAIEEAAIDFMGCVSRSMGSRSRSRRFKPTLPLDPNALLDSPRPAVEASLRS